MYAILFHAHQKLDTVAHGHLLKLIGPDVFFPSLKQILYFEGPNGPDSAKLKRKAKVEQPWHFINPYDETDTRLLDQIDSHFNRLSKSLKANDEVRSGFEAAWLAHALVDGLTPAHHYPYEEEVEKIMGKTRHDRKGIIGRAFVKGETMSQSVARSLKLIGPKGLVTTHALFEAGAYALIRPLKLTQALPTKEDIARLKELGLANYYREMVQEVDLFNFFIRFYQTGWTKSLVVDVRQELAPRMVKMITLAWYSASLAAG